MPTKNTPGSDHMETARTFLFVPGHRPDLFAKAASSGADAVIVDLEDAVGPENKDVARGHLLSWLEEHPETLVRINPPGAPWFDDDVAALAGASRLVMLPKASVDTVSALSDRLSGGSRVVALVETAAGILEAFAVAAHSSVVRLALGNVDLGADLDVAPDDRQALLAARSALVLASVAATKAAPIEGVTTSIDDPDRVRLDMEHAASLGFRGKLCIHPKQVQPAHEALRPSPDELAAARRIVAASGAGDVTVLDGKMLDRPVLIRAQRILARGALPF